MGIGIRRSMAGLAVAAAGIGALVTSAPATADTSGEQDFVIQGTCGQTFDPQISGAKAYWQVNCRNGNVWINGWVEDTASDGQCAKVKATYPNGDTWFSAPACPKGDRENFASPAKKGGSVNAYLYEYDV